MQTGKANYRLAARLRGNELLLDADLRKAVEEEHLRAVRRAEGLKCCADRRAFAESVEWERLGDFFLRVGSRPSAVRAYRDAALACLDGDYYDHGTEMLPCRFLRLRFLRMAETATACCAGDARLRAMLADDPLYAAYLTEHITKLRRSAEGLRRSSDPGGGRLAAQAESLAAELEERRCKG